MQCFYNILSTKIKNKVDRPISTDPDQQTPSPRTVAENRRRDNPVAERPRRREQILTNLAWLRRLDLGSVVLLIFLFVFHFIFLSR